MEQLHVSPDSPYSAYPKMHVAVDCLIFSLEGGKLKLLLTLRSFEPEKGKWSLLGGFIDRGESAEDAAGRVLHQLTGLDNVFMRQIGTFSSVGRDPGERVVSIAFCALLGPDDYDEERLKSHRARWWDVNNLPSLGFDHPDMVAQAISYLRKNLPDMPIVFSLLPKLFTLSQLQRLYEIIYATSFDKRNFRKRVADMPYVCKTDMIDKTGSRRGAYLYEFNSDLYHSRD